MAEKAEKYQKITHIEHVLKRPDTYIGSVEKENKEFYIFDESNEKFIKKQMEYIDGFMRIHMEIIYNAIDNIPRSREQGLICDMIKIEINEDLNKISVTNNGLSIPITQNNKNEYIPEIIFGNLMAGSNFDDKEDRYTTGRNGLGAKLTNIFSKYFEIEINDPQNEQIYKQIWENNMSKKNEPTIKKSKLKTGYVKITWTPDFEYFKLKQNHYTDDHIDLIKKIAYDIAGNSSKCTVMFNNTKIKFKSFFDYCKLYHDDLDKEHINIKHKNIESIDEFESNIVITAAYEKNSNMSISFINNLYTIDNGKHYQLWSDKILNGICQKLSKKNNIVEQKDIKKFFNIFVSCRMINPTFKSQSKNQLTGSKDIIDTNIDITTIINKIYKWDVINNIKAYLESKEDAKLKKTTDIRRKNIHIENYDAANKSGTKYSKYCSLLLCEGLSAKTYAVVGMSYIMSYISNMGYNITDLGENDEKKIKGRDWLGIYPLRGVPLNSRNATNDQILKNREITDIIKILNVEKNVDYTIKENFDKLTYGKIVILTDADSLTSDTPILLKYNNEIMIDTIDNIHDKNEWIISDNGKEYNTCKFQVWSDNGWTNIKSIMRHKTNKQIYRVNTHTGCVDVTEDHSLLKINGDEIKPNECNINDELLHSFPLFEDLKLNVDMYKNNQNFDIIRKIASDLKIQHYTKKTKHDLQNEINEILYNKTYLTLNNDLINDKLAYVYGLLFTDGNISIRQYNKTQKNGIISVVNEYKWSICNTNVDYLNKCKIILEDEYPNHIYKITCIKNRPNNRKDLYKLELYGNSKVADYITKQYNIFYNKDKCKIIPTTILNSVYNIRQSFFNGMWDGDGNKNTKNNKMLTISVYTKITSMCVYYICKSLNYEVSIDNRLDKINIYTMHITKRLLCKNPNIIKKIIKLENKEQYVYDLETENHHFHGGVGQMIVHNTDGARIKGLLLNIFHDMFKSLLSLSYIVCMKTPILKINTKQHKDMLFYNEYLARRYIDTYKTDIKNIKYYKGLGTSNNDDIKQSFAQFMETINYDDKTDEMMEIMFNKKKNFSDDRKCLIEQYKYNINDNVLESINKFISSTNNKIMHVITNRTINISNFIKNDMVEFSIANCKRTIPHIMDGLKQSQRKILYGVFEKNVGFNSKPIKVAQLSGYVSENTNYHHGEQNLCETIIKMAQSFVGTNNISLLYPEGQFGSRLALGEDAASPRYIFTKLNKYTRIIFNDSDDNILTKVIDDGDVVEPEFYVPIIPMILVNGCKGIATGFSTEIINFNIHDIIEYIKFWLINDYYDDNKIINPWYKGFEGLIKQINEKKWETYGSYNYDSSKGLITVSEIPILISINEFKECLDKLIEGKKILSYNNYSTENKPYFEIKIKPFDGDIFSLIPKSKSCLNISNMTLFDINDTLRKFDNVYDIIQYYCNIRYEYYEKRKKYLIDILEKELIKISNKHRFILHVIEDNTIVFKKKDVEITQTLEHFNYDKIDNSYEYLLSINVKSFTYELLEKLNKLLENKKHELSVLKSKKIKDIWLDDLDVLIKSLKSDNYFN